MWTKNAVDEALRTYVEDKARAAHLAMEIDELERRVNVAVKNLAADEASPKAQVITDMPHGTGVKNQVEDIVIKIASGWLPPEIREMKSELEAWKMEYNTLSSRTRYVDAWMGVLTERENWIVIHQYMRQEYWRDILDDYTRQFGQFASKDTLKRLRAKAFKRMYAIAGIKN